MVALGDNFTDYFAPWVARQVRGRSAGDLVEPKRAELTALQPNAPS
jgi:hypothetical protein